MELFPDSLAHDADLAALAVVEDAVVKHQLDFVEEVLDLSVLIITQLRLHRAKVHRLLHDVKVVRDAELHGVDWLVEDPRIRVLPERIYQPLCGLLPAVVDGSVLGHIGDLQPRNGVLHFEVAHQGWVLSLKLLILFVVEGLIVAVL